MTQKNILWSLLAILVACFSLVSCGGDGDGGGSASTTAGVVDKNTGLRVKSIGSNYIYYDDNGRIDHITNRSARYDFGYNPNTIVVDEGHDEMEWSVHYNGSGYITSVNITSSDEGVSGSWSYSYNFSEQNTLSYDGSGHLTKITSNGKETGVENGERYSATYTMTLVLTWRNNLLTQAVYTDKSVEDGYTETEKKTWTYAYDNDGYENIFRQYAPSITQFFDNERTSIFACIGLMGVGPVMLPSGGEVFREYSDEKTSTKSYTYRHTFNALGALSSVNVAGTSYSYTYETAMDNGKGTRARESAAVADEGRLPAKSLFHRCHRQWR